jgi:hypothetical protein
MGERPILICGFTGTRHGMSDEQKEHLRELFALGDISEFHHGDCIGADAEAHYIAADFNIPIIIHPPTNSVARAFCIGATIELPPKDYLTRNHDIVDCCDILLAAPKTAREEQRSGTWATVRYAKRKHVSYEILRGSP